MGRGLETSMAILAERLQSSVPLIKPYPQEKMALFRDASGYAMTVALMQFWGGNRMSMKPSCIRELSTGTNREDLLSD